MKWDPTKSGCVRRASLILCLWLALVVAPNIASAFTTVHFIDFQSQIASNIATLSSLDDPTREERNLLRLLNRASSVLAKTSASDGKTLRHVNSILGRNPACVPQLTTLASNLLLTFNSEHAFVGTLLEELPPSPAATLVTARYNALAPFVEKLNAAPNLAKFSALYDAIKSQLDAVFAEANQALIVPFPLDIPENSVKARINGISFSASAGSSSENHFNAVVTETNIMVTLKAETRAVNSSRGIYFSVPNAQPGTFRYVIPQAGVFINRTDIQYFPPSETQTAATEGVIFISTTPTEVYGIFFCSGPDFNVTFGRFRITISNQP
jgi:hypothetical protein